MFLHEFNVIATACVTALLTLVVSPLVYWWYPIWSLKGTCLFLNVISPGFILAITLHLLAQKSSSSFAFCSPMVLNGSQWSSVFLNVLQWSSMLINVPQCSLVVLSVPQWSSLFLSVPNWYSTNSHRALSFAHHMLFDQSLTIMLIDVFRNTSVWKSGTFKWRCVFHFSEKRNSTVDQICDLATQHNLLMGFVTRNLLDILAGNRPHQVLKDFLLLVYFSFVMFNLFF